MRFVIFFLVYFCAVSTSFAQHLKTLSNTNGTGWRKVAYIDSNGQRGFGKVTIYTPGGNFEPRYADIYWYSDWLDFYQLRTEDLTDAWPYWQGIRITNDGTYAYIEVNFLYSIDELNILSDDYGYCIAKPYAGNLLPGSGVVKAQVRNARFNIADQFIVNDRGNVAIGTTALLTAKLAVNGLIRAKEVKVETANWPDYVFKPSYHLRSLVETEQFIRENGHLPEVPTAEEVEKDGQALGEMNKILLKKMEEMTLYMIQLAKDNSHMKAEIEELKSKY